jgi:hypothetical protein
MRSDLRQFSFQKEYFLFLLPLFFVFHGYAEQYPLIGWKDILPVLLRYLAVSVLLSGVFFLFFRSWRKAFIMTLLVMSFQVFFGTLHDLAKSILPLSFMVKYIFLLPLILAGFVAFIIYLKRTNRRFDRLIKYANLVLLLFLVIDLVQWGWKLTKKKNDNTTLQAFHTCDSCSRPDIYFILADEYAGRKELQDIFQFDNTPFENALKQKGFHLVDSSTGNYNYTPFCMASIFSMDYLQGIEGRNQSRKDRRICYALINKNPVINFLKAQGYRMDNLSVFQFDDALPMAHSSFFLTGRDLLTSQTFLSRLDRDLRFNLVTRYKIKSEMERLAAVDLNSVQTLYGETEKSASEKTTQPRFIYTHLMMPHYPYFFDSRGKKNPVETLMEGEQGRKKEYIGYLQYANKKYLELIDHILATSAKPPIILFLGDHGFRHFTENVDPSYYFMNLSAVYLPNKNYRNFYPGMSTVNLFRVLFNTQFDQQLPLQKDSVSFLRE